MERHFLLFEVVLWTFVSLSFSSHILSSNLRDIQQIECVCVSFSVCSHSKTTQQRLCVIPIVAEMPPLLLGKIYVLFPWMESECQLVCVINTLHLGIEPQCQNLFIHIAHCQLSVSHFMCLSDLLKLNSICWASLYTCVLEEAKKTCVLCFEKSSCLN